MRNPGEITNGHKDLRATERIIISTKWWTDRLVEWLSEWILWNAGSLKLKVSGSLTIRASPDKRIKGGSRQLIRPRPFNLLWIHQKKLEPHLWLPLCCADVALGGTCPSALFMRASVENEGQVVGTGQTFLLHTDQGVNTCNILSEMTFFSPSDVLPMRI